jgi:hypothetical protein
MGAYNLPKIKMTKKEKHDSHTASAIILRFLTFSDGIDDGFCLLTVPI